MKLTKETLIKIIKEELAEIYRGGRTKVRRVVTKGVHPTNLLRIDGQTYKVEPPDDGFYYINFPLKDGKRLRLDLDALGYVLKMAFEIGEDGRWNKEVDLMPNVDMSNYDIRRSGRIEWV
jgi:hypothetical protein